MAFSLSRPSGRRADDVRSLRFRVRDVAFTGNYVTNGETITAKQLGLFRILFATPMNAFLAAPGTVVNATAQRIDLSADGKTVTIRQGEDAAAVAGSPFLQEKTNAEAYVASASERFLFIGE